MQPRCRLQALKKLLKNHATRLFEAQAERFRLSYVYYDFYRLQLIGFRQHDNSLLRR